MDTTCEMTAESAAKALLMALGLPKWAASVLVRTTGPTDELVLWIDESWAQRVNPPSTYQGFIVRIEPKPRVET